MVSSCERNGSLVAGRRERSLAMSTREGALTREEAHFRFARGGSRRAVQFARPIGPETVDRTELPRATIGSGMPPLERETVEAR